MPLVAVTVTFWGKALFSNAPIVGGIFLSTSLISIVTPVARAPGRYAPVI